MTDTPETPNTTSDASQNMQSASLEESPTTSQNGPQRLSGRAKFLVDFGPLAIFMGAYFLGRKLAPTFGKIFGQNWAIAEGQEMYLAVGLFLPAFAVAFAYSVWKEKRIAPMLLVSGVVIGVLGSLTLILHNKVFFYMKPTIVYALFAGVLGGGLWARRNLLKTAFDGALHLNEAAWRTLTVRYAIFFAILAFSHEIIWRWLMRDCDLSQDLPCAGEPIWVNIKVFGFTLINVVFAACQAPFLAKNMEETPQ